MRAHQDIIPSAYSLRSLAKNQILTLARSASAADGWMPGPSLFCDFPESDEEEN
jgi:hypothetical protein